MNCSLGRSETHPFLRARVLIRDLLDGDYVIPARAQKGFFRTTWRLAESTLASWNGASVEVLRLFEKFRQQHMKMMHSVFAAHRITTAIVERRLQSALHAFTEADVFPLHLVAEGDGLLHALVDLL